MAWDTGDTNAAPQQPQQQHSWLDGALKEVNARPATGNAQGTAQDPGRTSEQGSAPAPEQPHVRAFRLPNPHTTVIQPPDFDSRQRSDIYSTINPEPAPVVPPARTQPDTSVIVNGQASRYRHASRP